MKALNGSVITAGDTRIRGTLIDASEDCPPCTMEQYVAALRTEGLSPSLVDASIAYWLKGDYEAALRPLAAHARARLTGKGGNA